MADGRHLRDAADVAGFPGGSDEQQPARPFSHEIGAIWQKTERARLVERTGDPLGDELRPLGKNKLWLSRRRGCERPRWRTAKR